MLPQSSTYLPPINQPIQSVHVSPLERVDHAHESRGHRLSGDPLPVTSKNYEVLIKNLLAAAGIRTRREHSNTLIFQVLEASGVMPP
jgi:hypothetical protein